MKNFDDIRKIIVTDIRKAITALVADGKLIEQNDIFLLNLGQLNDIEKDYRLGLITQDLFYCKQQQIRYSILKELSIVEHNQLDVLELKSATNHKCKLEEKLSLIYSELVKLFEEYNILKEKIEEECKSESNDEKCKKLGFKILHLKAQIDFKKNLVNKYESSHSELSRIMNKGVNAILLHIGSNLLLSINQIKEIETNYDDTGYDFMGFNYHGFNKEGFDLNNNHFSEIRNLESTEDAISPAVSIHEIIENPINNDLDDTIDDVPNDLLDLLF